MVLGRPKGKHSAPDKYKLSGKDNLIVSLINAGISKRQIAKICKVDRNTLQRYLPILAEKRTNGAAQLRDTQIESAAGKRL